MKIKYHHLFAWDCMMGSYNYWKEMMQAKAEEENAPLTAVYKAHDGSWIKFEDIRSEGTKLLVKQYLPKEFCPRCGLNKLKDGLNALSRKDNQTEICDECGTAEALEELGI